MNDEDDGQYHPGKYPGPDGEDGQYVHDNSGQYIVDNSGQYKHEKGPGFYRAKGNLNKFRSDGNFAGNFVSGSKSKFAQNNFVRPNNQLREFEDNFGNTKSSGKFASSSPSYEDDQFLSSTIAPTTRILHRKPLQGIKDVEFFRKPLTSHSANHQSKFFGDIPAGTVFNPKTTHSAIRFPTKYY